MKDEMKVVEEATAGKIGILYGPWWLYEWPLNQVKDKDPKADWICVQIPTAPGNVGKAAMDRITMDRYYVVTKDCKNPEALVKLLNLYTDMSLNNPPEFQPENGFVWQWVPTFYVDPFDIDTLNKKFNKALAVNPLPVKPAGFAPTELDLWKKVPAYLQFKAGKAKFNGSDFGMLMARIDNNLAWGKTVKIAQAGDVTYNEFYGASTATMQEKGASLDKLTEETFTKIIMGASPVSDFDKYVINWKKLGGDAITKEVNDWYTKSKK
jgi:putative aldouronate transport system substrate-binding protein